MNQEILEKVWDVIDSERVCQTLIEMVDIYSPSGKEEDIQLYIQDRLEAVIATSRSAVDAVSAFVDKGSVIEEF